MPFPKMLCFIVVVQLLPWFELGSTDDAGVHLQLTRLYDVFFQLAGKCLIVSHTPHMGLGSLDHDLTYMYSGGVTWLLRLVEDEIILEHMEHGLQAPFAN